MVLQRLLRFAYARRAAVLAAAGLVLGISVFLLTRLSFETNVLSLLPQSGPTVRSFDAYLRHFGTLDHIYILFEAPGGRIADQEEFVDRYVEGLRALPEIGSVDAALFDEVKDWGYLFDRELLLLGPDDARAALERLRPDAIASEIGRARGMLAMASPDVKAYIQQDPLGLLRLLRERMARGRSLVSFDPTQTGYVSPDGKSRLVIAKPVRPPFDTDFSKRLFEQLARVEAKARREAADLARADEDAGADTAATPATDVRVQVAGGYRVALEAERQIRRESIVNSISSLAGLLVLVFLVFRTPWILLFGMLPLVLAAAFTLGVNGLAGPLSPATSGSSAMLFGLGIDGIGIMYLRYIEERARGFRADEAIGRTAGTAKSVILAYATTGATFLALTLIDFPSLQQLGRLVGIGILACCALLLTLLPALIGLTSPERQQRPITSAWLARLATSRPRRVLLAAAVLTVVFGAAATRLRLDTGLERLQARTEGAALEEQLAARFSLPRDVVIALAEGPRLDPLLAAARKLAAGIDRETPSVAFASPDVLLPPAADQEQVANLVRESGVEASTVGLALEREAQKAGFRPGTFQPFIDRLPRLLDPAQRLTYEGLVQHGLAPLVSRFVTPTPHGYMVVLYLYPRSSSELDAVEALAGRIAPSFTLTGVPPVNRELKARFLPQFLKGVGIGSLAVVAFIFAVFRRARPTLLALLPALLGFTWSAGILGLLGVQLDLFSMFAAMAFIGIATDYGIYIVHRHVEDGGGDIGEVVTQTGTGILIAGSTTLIGFGSLINSSYAPLRSFGITSVVTVGSCLVAALLVLPALLAEWQARSASPKPS